MNISLLGHSLVFFSVLSSIHCLEYENNDKDKHTTSHSLDSEYIKEIVKGLSRERDLRMKKLLVRRNITEIRIPSNQGTGKYAKKAWKFVIVGIVVLIKCCFLYYKCRKTNSSDDKAVKNVIAPPQQLNMKRFQPQNPKGSHQNIQDSHTAVPISINPIPLPYPAGSVDNSNYHYPAAPNHM